MGNARRTSQVCDHTVLELMRFCHRTVTQLQFGHLYLLFLHNSLGKEVIFFLFLKLDLFKALESLLPIPFQDTEAEHFRSSSFYDIAFCHYVLLPSILKPCLQGSDVQWRSGHLTLKMRPMHGLETLGNETQWWNAVSQKNESLSFTVLICPSFHLCVKFYSCILPWIVPLKRSPLGHCHYHHHHLHLHHHHHQLYGPGWAMAYSSKHCQRPVSWASASQFLQPSFLASSSTPTVHLDFGQPRPLWPPAFVHNISLGNSFSSSFTPWSTHLSLLDFITLTILSPLGSH